MRGRKKNIRGEMLVETIVAFAVLTILLTMALSVIRGGIALNNRAIANLAALHTDCVQMETWSQAPTDEDTLTLAYVDGSVSDSDPGDYTCTVELDVYSGKILQKYSPITDG